jgi:hypothetical protein
MAYPRDGSTSSLFHPLQRYGIIFIHSHLSIHFNADGSAAEGHCDHFTPAARSSLNIVSRPSYAFVALCLRVHNYI